MRCGASAPLVDQQLGKNGPLYRLLPMVKPWLAIPAAPRPAHLRLLPDAAWGRGVAAAAAHRLLPASRGAMLCHVSAAGPPAADVSASTAHAGPLHPVLLGAFALLRGPVPAIVTGRPASPRLPVARRGAAGVVIARWAVVIIAVTADDVKEDLGVNAILEGAVLRQPFRLLLYGCFKVIQVPNYSNRLHSAGAGCVRTSHKALSLQGSKTCLILLLALLPSAEAEWQEYNE